MNLGLLRSSASALCITYLLKKIEKKTHHESNCSNYGEVNNTTDKILPPIHFLRWPLVHHVAKIIETFHLRSSSPSLLVCCLSSEESTTEIFKTAFSFCAPAIRRNIVSESAYFKIFCRTFRIASERLQ